MAVTEAFSGTQAIDSVEWSLTTDTAGPDAETSDGVFQLFLDLSDMVAGDELRLRLYEKVRDGDTQRVVSEQTFIGVQSPPVVPLPAVALMHGWDFTLQMVGVGSPTPSATINWSIRKAA